MRLSNRVLIGGSYKGQQGLHVTQGISSHVDETAKLTTPRAINALQGPFVVDAPNDVAVEGMVSNAELAASFNEEQVVKIPVS